MPSHVRVPYKRPPAVVTQVVGLEHCGEKHECSLSSIKNDVSSTLVVL